MLRYWIVRRSDGSPVGLLRTENGRASFTLTAPVEGQYRLFSETEDVPILPGTEVCLPDAVALLGTDGERETCFAAASSDVPLDVFRKRVSQIYTKKAEEPETVQDETNMTQEQPEPADARADFADDLSLNNTIETDPPADIAETVRDTEEFSLLLRHAEAFYKAYETVNMVQNKDNIGIDLFPQAFPGAKWRFVDGPDVLPHYEGMWDGPGGAVRILAVRGRAAPRPPRALVGFTRFLRGSDGAGYWIRRIPIG